VTPSVKSGQGDGHTPTSYQLGWDDGYAEGYACKLADATERFNPTALARPEAVERMADHLQRKLASVYGGNRSPAIGMARALLETATAAMTARTRDELLQEFLEACRGCGRAGTSEMPDGPYMAMTDAAAV
jgi:hypothetical protein